MKIHCFIYTIFLLLFSCQEAELQTEGVNERIQYRITEFYKGKRTEDYTPVYYSPLDTIKRKVMPNGEKISTTGILLHKYEARNKEGELQLYQDSVEVKLFEDGTIIAIPNRYITKRR